MAPTSNSGVGRPFGTVYAHRVRMATRVSRRGPWPVVSLMAAVLWAAVSVGAGVRVMAWSGGVNQATDVTVRGCVERDAASRAALYRLAEDAPGTRIFRLTFPKDIDVPAQVGHTVEVTGTIAAGAAQARDPELVVKKLTSVRDTCSTPARR